MSNDKYVGLDVHQASIVCAVHKAQGKCLAQAIIETKAATIRDFRRGLSGTLHVTFEEGTQAAWLYDLIRPLVVELVVCNPRRNHLLKVGSKATVWMPHDWPNCCAEVFSSRSITARQVCGL